MNPTRQGLNQFLKIWILCLFCKSVISSYYICQFCYFCNKWFELIVFICDFCIQVLDVKRLIVIICPNILLFGILKIPSATPGDNLILWTSAVRSLTGPDSLVGWPQICGCYVISLPPKWGAPWGTLCYHSLILGPFFRRLFGDPHWQNLAIADDDNAISDRTYLWICHFAKIYYLSP